MELQDQIDTGRCAEEFLRYTSEHPYFEGLLERIKLEYARQILEIDPTYYGRKPARDQFVELKLQMNAMDGVMNAVRGDIYIASEALKQMEGIIDKGGIL
jgi:hypothetical protein